MYGNQNQQANPYQPVPYQNNQNMYNPNPANNGGNPGGYGYSNNYNNPGQAVPMNLYNPGNFRGSVPNQQMGNQNNQNKLADDQLYSGSLVDDARKGFVTKVYILLSLQLILTTLIGYIAYNSTFFRQTFINTPMVVIVSVALLAVTLVIGCCTDFFRKYALPLFILFTVLMSLLVAMAICGFQSKVVLLAVGITLFLTIALTIYAWKTDSDLTGCGVYLMIIGLVLLVFGIVTIFWRDPIVQLIYACLGALVFAVYLVFDTQLILGKKTYGYSLDDSYMAAIQLYMDIIQLFLNLLQIIGYFDR